MTEIPLEWWTLIVGTLLPAAVALVTARYSSSKWGALALVALTTLAAVLAEIPDGRFDWSDVGENFLVLFVIAVVAHFGLLKPGGLTGNEGVIRQAVPGGIGGTSSRQVFNGGPAD